MEGGNIMTVSFYELISPVHDKNSIDKSLFEFQKNVEKFLDDKIAAVPLEEAKKLPVTLLFIKSGGVESEFLKIYKELKPPYILLTSEAHNSLPAAMEILSFIKQKGENGEILHGPAEYIASRLGFIKKIINAKHKINGARLGVIGKPSDWLIGSSIDYKKVKKTFGIELVNIEMAEVLNEIKNHGEIKNSQIEKYLAKGASEKESKNSMIIYDSLKNICAKYKLSGFTLRCFDLLTSIKSTGCLALSMLNDEGITAGCEGDIPALLSMFVLRALTELPSFMANPSVIDPQNNTAIFAHCTVPTSITEEYILDTHFESGIGVGVKGRFVPGECTIFKISPALDKYFLSPAHILRSLNRENLCRTQIEVSVETGVEYFLNNPYGNHHIILNSNQVELIKEFFKIIF